MDWKVELDGLKAFLKIFMWIGIVGGGLAIAGRAWDAAEQGGWLPHSGNASVMFPPHGWEQGQYVGCFAVISNANTIVLDCSEATLATIVTREMDVTFWGKVTEKSTQYRCQRGQDAIACHLQDVPPAQAPAN